MDLPIPVDWVLQGGAGGIVVLVVMMILTGRLIPRSFVQQLEQDRNYWREAALKSIDHTDELLPGATISANFAAELHKALTAKADSDSEVRSP